MAVGSPRLYIYRDDVLLYPDSVSLKNDDVVTEIRLAHRMCRKVSKRYFQRHKNKIQRKLKDAKHPLISITDGVISIENINKEVEVVNPPNRASLLNILFDTEFGIYLGASFSYHDFDYFNDVNGHCFCNLTQLDDLFRLACNDFDCEDIGINELGTEALVMEYRRNLVVLHWYLSYFDARLNDKIIEGDWLNQKHPWLDHHSPNEWLFGYELHNQEKHNHLSVFVKRVMNSVYPK